MSRERKGSIVDRTGKICARVQFTGSDGKRRDLWRKADNRTHARDVVKHLFREIADDGEAHIDATRMTGNDFCDYYTSITTRLALELERLRERTTHDQNALVFGVRTVIRQAFDKACKEALRL